MSINHQNLPPKKRTETEDSGLLQRSFLSKYLTIDEIRKQKQRQSSARQEAGLRNLIKMQVFGHYQKYSHIMTAAHYRLVFFGLEYLSPKKTKKQKKNPSLLRS